ncbi:MAG TPA: hypothetical protein VF779_20730 [Pyrinomonadaceae bacterium]
MSHQHLIVVSAENNPYMAWQSKLFHFSCLSRLKQLPVIVVHETDAGALHRDFQDIIKAGGRVVRAKSYKLSTRGDIYRPRNTPGSLLSVVEEFGARDEFIVLCDPDMIFARDVVFPETLTGDFCSYINFDRDFVEDARHALDIPRALIDEQKESLRCGVPYVIHARDARALGEAWLEAIDAFSARKWEDVMYAFGLAAVKLGFKVNLTHMAQSNYWPDAILKMDVVHYCYGDESWSKRHYFHEAQAQTVWRPRVEAATGTVLGEILKQIGEAEKFYAT